jgi:hypothetical protein
MARKRVAALPNSPTLLELWDVLGSKLIEAAQESLPSKQRLKDSNSYEGPISYPVAGGLSAIFLHAAL